MRSILFVLPVSGGSGGAHSVMQEAETMRAMGIDARIATNLENLTRLRHAYRDLPAISAQVSGYDGAAGLAELIEATDPEVTVATTNQSVHTLALALKPAAAASRRTAYYIQDYEPLFYPRDSSDWHAAYASYGLVPGMLHFAKTRWLQETVENNHRIQVAKVEPSVDHRLYYPDLGARLADREVLTIAAMVRPATPRRAPRRTMRILAQVARLWAGRVRCVSFGCTPEDLVGFGLEREGVEHLGVLSRTAVADLFRGTDFFLDLSDYQAFGRTAIEAMSCGAPAVVPAHGGAYEFAEHCRNAFIVDVRSDEAILAAVRQFIGMNAQERRGTILRAVEAGYRYSLERAALSEIALLLE